MMPRLNHVHDWKPVTFSVGYDGLTGISDHRCATCDRSRNQLLLRLAFIHSRDLTRSARIAKAMYDFQRRGCSPWHGAHPIKPRH